MTLSLALDVSHFAGELSVSQFQRAAERGVTRIIVGVSPSNISRAKRQMDAANAAGLEVQAYVYMYFNPTFMSGSFITALSNIPSYVKFVWIDVEDTTSGRTGTQIQEMVESAISTVVTRGFNTGIYTAKWFWDVYMKRPDGTPITYFQSAPLWDAWFNDVQDMVIRPYGGWTTAAMRQIKGDMYFNDIWCDLNVYELAAPVLYTQAQLDAAVHAAKVAEIQKVRAFIDTL